MAVLPQQWYRKLRFPEKITGFDNGNRNSIVLSELKFNALLCQERRRAERSGRPFLLMLATPGRVSENGSGAAYLDGLAPALAAAIRTTDTIGWQRQDQCLGAIFTELGTSEKGAILTSIKNKVTAIIDKQMPGTNTMDLNLAFYLFPESSGHESHSAFRLHPELYPERSSRNISQSLKRVIDVTGSVLALMALSPILLAISLVIKLTSKGPVLFRQVRVGQHGKQFVFFKFRSMYADSDATLHREYVSHFIAGKALMKESADGKTSAYKVIDDPRVTPLGRFLRKTSLDELPQLLNVIRGEMSLVGPRPPLPYELACYDAWHLRRVIEVAPGITGLWQVCGRSRTSFDEMVRLDLRYAHNWSLALDFVILLRTPGAVVSGDGAY